MNSLLIIAMLVVFGMPLAFIIYCAYVAGQDSVQEEIETKQEEHKVIDCRSGAYVPKINPQPKKEIKLPPKIY